MKLFQVAHSGPFVSYDVIFCKQNAARLKKDWRDGSAKYDEYKYTTEPLKLRLNFKPVKVGLLSPRE